MVTRSGAPRTQRCGHAATRRLDSCTATEHGTRPCTNRYATSSGRRADHQQVHPSRRQRRRQRAQMLLAFQAGGRARYADRSPMSFLGTRSVCGHGARDREALSRCV
eukprot:1987697-Prymnesium_polylepis.2